jgi:hypothetical protein
MATITGVELLIVLIFMKWKSRVLTIEKGGTA